MRKFIAFFIVVFSLLPIAGVVAQHNNLQWYVQKDQEIRYQITRSSEIHKDSTTSEYDISYIVVLTVEEITQIPTSVVSPLDIDYLPVSLKFENDSAFSDTLIPIQLYTPLILPIGNWSLLNSIYSELLDSIYSNVSIYDRSDLWGYTSMITQYDTGSYFSIDYSKADGVMLHFESSLVFSDFGIVHWKIERVSSIDISLVIIILAVVGMISIILIYGWKRKTS